MPDLAGLRKADEARKPTNADVEWIRLNQFYEDAARAQIVSRLKELGVGLRDNARPLEINLLRRIIDRIAVVYDQSPNRFLVDSTGGRRAEDSPDHKSMLRALRLAQYDLAWRRADKLRSLMRQVVLRFSPSDARGACVLRIFEPFNVVRDPSPDAPDELDSDRRFALLLQGDPLSTTESEQLWEYWERRDDRWHMAWVDKAGQLVADQPLDRRADKSGPPSFDVDLVSPYAELPCQVVYDEYSGGRSWLPPPSSRTAWVECINALGNDLWALVVNQAHTDRFFKTDDTTAIPSKKGPGQAAAVPADTDIVDMSPNPAIDESRKLLDGYVKLWSVTEDLPVDEFLNRQTATGAALKASERALQARREAQVLLVPEDERRAYRRLRGVWNVHAATWNTKELADGLDLEVEIPEIRQPVDQRELLEGHAKSQALGSKSTIDLIQAETGASRAAAIRIYERVALDREQFPAPASMAIPQDGPKLAGVSEDAPRADLDGSPSVVQAIKKA